MLFRSRLVPLSIGILVLTISDIYIIGGNGTTNSPILPAVPYLQGVGLANYNALDIDGTLIGFFTTDKQFVILDPSAGLSYVGYPIGDQFRQNNGKPGTSWILQKYMSHGILMVKIKDGSSVTANLVGIN